MACSSRWRARPLSRWQLQPIAERKRETCELLYCSPNRRRISCPIRGSVHNSVAKPAASAPAFSNRPSSWRSALPKRDGRPCRRWIRNPSRPAAFSRRCQCITVVAVMPTSRTTSAWLQPFSSSRPARRRRRSNAFCSSSRRIAIPSVMPGRSDPADPKKFTQFTQRSVEFVSTGIEPRPDRIRAHKVYNPNEGVRVVRGKWSAVQGNPLYRGLLRPVLARGLRERFWPDASPRDAAAGPVLPGDGALHHR